MGEKMPFKTWLTNPPKTEPSPAGYQYEPLYQEEIDKDGKLSLVVTGQTDIRERIQQDLESTKIENILHAVAMGDLTALQQREATYCDCTSMPKNLMEAQNTVLKLKQEFYNLPLDVRKEFENSPEMYVSQMGTEEFNNKMAPFNEKIAAIQEAGNLEAYNKRVAEQAKFERDVAKAKGETNE